MALDDDSNMLDPSHKIATSATQRPSFSARWLQRAPSITGSDVWWSAGRDRGRSGTVEQPQVLAYISDRTLITVRDLSHLRYGEPMPTVYHIDNDLTLPGIEVSCHFTAG